MTPETEDPVGAEASLDSRMLQTMLLIRAFDSNLARLYDRGLIQGSSHASIGQEAVAVGACAALLDEDYVTSTHRGHGHAIARGADLTRMTAELIGRETGYCRGKGGSMHIADFSKNMLGANGIVGGGFGIATGAALASRLLGRPSVALCFFGDGALNQGSFLECANMAKIWALPVVFMCENNHYAMSATPDKMLGIPDLTARAAGLGIPGVEIDGMDARAVHRTVSAAVIAARSGQGPQFVAAECYRFEGHFSGDTMSYRDSAESAQWKERDPIQALSNWLIGEGALTAAEFEEYVAAAQARVDHALTAAVEAPFPDPSQAWEDLYA